MSVNTQIRFLLTIAVFLAFWLFFHSGLFDYLLARLLNLATADLPATPNRRERKRLKRIPGAVSFSTQKKQFWYLVGFLSALTLLDLFVLPTPYRLEFDWLFPCLVATFEAALIIIFVGTMCWHGRNNWSKWTFWTSVATTVLILLWVCHVLHARDPRGLFGLLFLSLMQFLWLFGILGRIDRSQAELRQLNSSQSVQR